MIFRMLSSSLTTIATEVQERALKPPSYSDESFHGLNKETCSIGLLPDVDAII